jgi:hypothetical protein
MTETIAGIDIPDTELAREATELVRKAGHPAVVSTTPTVCSFSRA